MLCQMNYKQQRYEQDDSLSIIFYMQTVHKSLENFRELFCLESNVKGYLRWISQVLKALGRNQCPGCPLQCLIRMHNDVTWFFSQCCLSYAMQPHRRTDTIRRNRFDYTGTNSDNRFSIFFITEVLRKLTDLLNKWIKYCRPYLRQHGIYLCKKGKNI